MVIGDTYGSGFDLGFFKIEGDACGIGIDGGIALFLSGFKLPFIL